MDSPFIFDVSGLDGGRERQARTAPAPERIGVAMIAVPQGAEVTVDADLTDLGTGVQVLADVTAPLEGQCSRCLRELHREGDFHVEQFFAYDADVFTESGDAPEDGEDDEDDLPPLVVEERVDLTQAVTDEIGLNLPFSPVCEDGCEDSDSEVPAPDGIAGEYQGTDPRWSGLEKFL